MTDISLPVGHNWPQQAQRPTSAGPANAIWRDMMMVV